ncbi:hypothetical protein [Halorhodospira neutriphila]|uniref:hypothetical protein n=1 Tax=Halorhodospira neutriphila TaxID=168379 RepID=UPI0019045569|nr:hypothetical protein [Halorhodospira neutriphila]
MRDIRVRAAQSDRRLKDVVEELLRRGLAAPAEPPASDPLHAWLERLERHADGSVTNPDGIEDEAFFQALEAIREADRASPPRDPFAGQA